MIMLPVDAKAKVQNAVVGTSNEMWGITLTSLEAIKDKALEKTQNVGAKSHATTMERAKIQKDLVY